MKTISVKLPDHLNDQLTRLAAARHKAKSQLIRKALEEGLARWTEAEEGLTQSPTEKYAGLFEGPVDLSENRSHLGGFGE